MKSIINFFKSLFSTKEESISIDLLPVDLLPTENKKEEIFCETVKKEASIPKRGRKPKTENGIEKKAKAPAKKSKKSEN